jgi:putative transcriptional regulator
MLIYSIRKDMFLMVTVKNNLLEIRMKLMIRKQQEFADLLQLDRSDYTQLENNKKQVSLEKAIKIFLNLKEMIPDLHMEDIFNLNDK